MAMLCNADRGTSSEAPAPYINAPLYEALKESLDPWRRNVAPGALGAVRRAIHETRLAGGAEAQVALLESISLTMVMLQQALAGGIAHEDEYVGCRARLQELTDAFFGTSPVIN